jgi:hypothetical protein
MIADDDRLEPDRSEQLRCDRGRRPVRAVDGDADAAERSWMVEHRPQVIEVGRDHAPSAAARLAGRACHDRVRDNRLHLALDRS